MIFQKILKIYLKYYLIGILGLSFGACQTTSPQSKTEGAAQNPEPQSLTNYWSPAARLSKAAYYFSLGTYVSLMNDSKEALKYYSWSYQLDGNPYTGSQRVFLLAAMGHIKQAEFEARRLVLLNPKSMSARIVLAQIYIGAGKLSLALREYNEIIKLDPKNENFKLLVIDLLLKLKRFAEAKEKAQDLAKLNPGIASFQMARIYLIEGKYKEALVEAKKSYQLLPFQLEVTILLAILYELNHNNDQALVLYEKILRAQASNDELIRKIVELYQATGGLNEALSLIEDLEERAKGFKPSLALQKAVIFWQMGRFQEAADTFEKILKSDQKSDRIIFLTGLTYERLHQLDRALELYNSIPENSSWISQIRIRRLSIYTERKEWPAAEKIIEDILAQTNEGILNLETTHAISAFYEAKGDLSRAAKFVENQSKLQPNNSKLLMLLAIYQEKQDEIEACKKTLRTILNIDPSNGEALNFLAYLFAERGENLEEAEKLVLTALRIKPDNGIYLDTLGWTHWQKTEYKKAEAILLKARELSPKEVVIYEHLAETYRKLEDKENARRFFELGLKMPNAEERDRRRIEKKYKEFMEQHYNSK